METYPGSQPVAPVADSPPVEKAPALWNPNAAANLCIVFTTAFGAWLHMRNWQALGEPKKAARSRVWMWAGIGAYVAVVMAAQVLPSMVSSSQRFAVSIAMILAWYFTSAREQMRYVKERFGDGYPRRHWALPIVVGIGGVCVAVAIAFVFRFVAVRLHEV